MTTREKILRVVDELRSTPVDDLSGEGRDLIEFVQIAQGFGLDILGMVVPTSDAEADMMVDKLLALLLDLRGDDLPPFDPDRYGEAVDDGRDA